MMGVLSSGYNGFNAIIYFIQMEPEPMTEYRLSQADDPDPASVFTFRGKTIRLSPLEARLWEGLVLGAGEWRDRSAFMRHVWRGEDPASSRAINVLVHQLRENIMRQARQVDGKPNMVDVDSWKAAEALVQTSTKKGQGWRLRPGVEQLVAAETQPTRKWV